MPFREIYQRQARLLIKILPHVAEETCFALKGGTGINLFIRAMPRLSVDIDLTYLPVASREESLAAINTAMKRIAGRLRKSLPKAEITGTPGPEKVILRLLVRDDGVQVKIEVNPVLRGTVYEAELRTVSRRVEEAFGFAEMHVVSAADLYAGKIVAALDRQHPRDFFDVKELLANEGIDDLLRRAFIVYLISHNRPMAEVLAPPQRSIREEYRRGFEGMTAEPVSIEELVTVRERLIAAVVGEMPEAHRRFLISFERGAPEWTLLDVPGASELPAVLWRQQNLKTLTSSARAELVSKLEQVLFPAHQLNSMR